MLNKTLGDNIYNWLDTNDKIIFVIVLLISIVSLITIALRMIKMRKIYKVNLIYNTSMYNYSILKKE